MLNHQKIIEKKVTLIVIFTVTTILSIFIINTNMELYKNHINLIIDKISDKYNKLRPVIGSEVNDALLKQSTNVPHKYNDEYYKFSPVIGSDVNDTLLKQLNFVPHKYNEATADEKYVVILSNSPILGTHDIKQGTELFKKCLVNKCTLNSLRYYNTNRVPDAIIFNEYYNSASIPAKPRQVRIFFTQECPRMNPKFRMHSVINWTATYRKDSDLPVPYRKWVYYNNAVKTKHQTQNFAKSKSKKVAWVVSNCHANNHRMEYAKELRKYIDIDIYGRCGNMTCSKGFKCFDELQQYKFYLAFENSNCMEYITEKLFVNALQHNTIPLVMGAPYEDYLGVAPQNSFIYVDHFENPKELAEYLHEIDKDDDLYNSYFEWKGTGEYLEKSFYCRLCSKLHSDYKDKSYKDINKWWRPKDVCVKEPWNTV